MSEAARFFDAIAKRYDRVYARSRDELAVRMRRVTDLLGALPKDVIDLGVGTGSELPYLLDRGHRLIGVDVSLEMLALCNKRSRKIPCIQADFWDRIPLPDASADAVIALFGALAHAPHESAYAVLAREVARLLRPGGVFYAEVPTAEWAALHPMFEDEVTKARIAIRAPTKDQWRAHFLRASADFEVSFQEANGELSIVCRGGPHDPSSA